MKGLVGYFRCFVSVYKIKQWTIELKLIINDKNTTHILKQNKRIIMTKSVQYPSWLHAADVVFFIRFCN